MKFSHNLLSIFWSIYFVLMIGIVGFFLGYLASLSLYILSFCLKPFARPSESVLHLAENLQCRSIRLLLRLQPWLDCKTNLPPISGFFENFGTRKIMFVANHRSNLDTFMLISYIPGLRGLAKSSLFYNVFFAPMMLTSGFIPIEKGNPNSFIRGLKLLRTRILSRNRPVLIFPETTRCEKGFAGVNKFTSSIFQVAIDSQALIVPIVLKNTDLSLGRGDLFLTPHKPMEICMLEPLNSSGYKDSQQLAGAVWNSIHQELT